MGLSVSQSRSLPSIEVSPAKAGAKRYKAKHKQLEPGIGIAGEGGKQLLARKKGFKEDEHPEQILLLTRSFRSSVPGSGEAFSYSWN